MGFKKMTRQKYPPRLWSLVGYPRSGKSTFAARLKGPMVVIDADHRFQEVLELADNEVFELSDTRSDNVDPNQITKLLNQNMPGSGVETIVVDHVDGRVAERYEPQLRRRALARHAARLVYAGRHVVSDARVADDHGDLVARWHLDRRGVVRAAVDEQRRAALGVRRDVLVHDAAPRPERAVFGALADDEIDDLHTKALAEIRVTDDFLHTKQLAVDKSFELFEAIADTFPSGVANKSALILALSLVAMGTAIFWPTLRRPGRRDGEPVPESETGE